MYIYRPKLVLSALLKINKGIIDEHSGDSSHTPLSIIKFRQNERNYIFNNFLLKKCLSSRLDYLHCAYNIRFEAHNCVEVRKSSCAYRAEWEKNI